MITIDLKHDTDGQIFYVEVKHAATRIGQEKHVAFQYGHGKTAEQAVQLAYAAQRGAVEAHKMMLDAMQVSHNSSDLLHMITLAKEIDKELNQ